MGYFVDENMISVGRALAVVRSDVVHPGHVDLPEVPTGTLDETWLPVIGADQKDLVLITRDRNIRRKPAELEAFKSHGVRAFFVTGKNELSKWDKLSLIVKMWDRMEKAVARNGDGPWAMGLTANNLRDIPLTPATD